jgi:hypothetical protein
MAVADELLGGLRSYRKLMKQELYMNRQRNAGPRRAGARCLIYALCVALPLLPSLARATGTGTVDRISGWYPAGTNLTATATPDAYSTFDYWTGDTNGAAIAGDQISFDVTLSMSITAVIKDTITETNAVPHRWLAEQDPAWAADFEAAVSTDADGDGFTTGQEYWSGTDPLNKDSLLKIDSILFNGANVIIEWEHASISDPIPDMIVKASDDLNLGVWVPVGTNTPVNGTNSWVNASSSRAYYRLEAPYIP